MFTNESTRQSAQTIYDFLIMNPEVHEQASWVKVNDGPEYHGTLDSAKLFDENNLCGTTMCIAGTAVYLEQGKEGLRKAAETYDWYGVASPLLGFDDYSEAQELFANCDNDMALDMLNAIAQGDMTKFNHLAEERMTR